VASCQYAFTSGANKKQLLFALFLLLFPHARAADTIRHAFDANDPDVVRHCME
jgi:hypothetical protein